MLGDKELYRTITVKKKPYNIYTCYQSDDALMSITNDLVGYWTLDREIIMRKPRLGPENSQDHMKFQQVLRENIVYAFLNEIGYADEITYDSEDIVSKFAELGPEIINAWIEAGVYSPPNCDEK